MHACPLVALRGPRRTSTLARPSGAVAVGPGERARRGLAGGGATSAPSPSRAIGDLQEVADPARLGSASSARLAAHQAGGLPGGTSAGSNDGRGCFGVPAGVPEAEVSCPTSCARAQTRSFKGTRAYRRAV